jgi:hypothetical protein
MHQEEVGAGCRFESNVIPLSNEEENCAADCCDYGGYERRTDPFTL